MRRAETTAMTWWGTPGLYCHTSAVFIQPAAACKLWEKPSVCVLICVFSLRGLSSVMLPQWKSAFDLFKKRVMPTSCYPQACQSCLRGKGPHNLLFVPLLLRKYFLDSSFSVYFYYSCFLPWFTPILSYLFAFQTPVWFIMANLPQKDFKKLLLSWLWTVFICPSEPEGGKEYFGDTYV